MIKIKFENKEQLKKSTSLINDYEKFDLYMRCFNASLFIIILFLTKCPIIIPFIIFFIAIVLNVFKVVERIIDLMYDCPCEVKQFRKSLKKIKSEADLIKTYEAVKEMAERYPSAVVMKMKKGYKVVNGVNNKSFIELKGKWNLKTWSNDTYTIDFDNMEIR